MIHSLPNTDASDSLIGIILYIFLETGFVPSNLTDDFSSISTYCGYEFIAQIPKQFMTSMTSTFAHQKSSTNAKEQTFSLKLLNFSEEQAVLNVRKLFNGDAICLTLCFGCESTSVCLPVNKFIKMNSTQQFCLDYLLENLNDLVAEIKINLIRPIRNQICLSSGYGCPNINGLPKETLDRVLVLLDLKSLQNLSQACVYLRDHVITYLNESKRYVTTRRSTPIEYYDPMRFNRILLDYRYPWSRRQMLP